MLIRQPNGKLCMCNWNGEIEKMNLTEEDYITYCTNKAREFVYNQDNIKNLGELIKAKSVSDEQLKEMGSDKTFAELIKFVPCAPIRPKYIPVNFETQAICPSCGGIVVDGMGGTDKKCKKCGQLIKWQ
jgi:hypothetical protein